MCLARGCLTICKNGAVEAIKNLVDDGFTHFLVNVVVVVVLTEDAIESVRCVRLLLFFYSGNTG